MVHLDLTTTDVAKGAEEVRAATPAQRLLAAAIAAMTIIVVVAMMMATI